ncbi:suppressor of mec-8 and unc-52 protein homolog 1 isoform X1 [Populus trichocarpa]|uniref:suppressor of mec-8 and unc-52 protein homolog 1 isoform X1 n=1 Tax=Populus trichocarpa TaxID=3694 RepID=UPI000D18A1FF|nr:suppressor of mec-8 and unc-52 protein homolog 1 isoform X1 [Populus trichocarpa]XP_024461056.1 suppressor of mec-8 and unc-52 protein homolog 1 isoform X1 [Populus trichocarpa]XP_024461064.1 suppressor of mec-8 and unc-52 protein homolog 1 isoform X1 [Populus trichocarpa]XP_024461069.1 suppressor of mec-8 and unc-52 protein homolog 1 isoform X1 [Populus trichocarpa]|eukprot:XP_024461049.1 suppressor of mec-8 and unc-52 protein homolog 1 isoform X1 [Populus trichocarpa]
MMHDDPVLCVDSEMLASGAKDGRIKVWCTRTGQCLRCIECAHSQGVTSLAFSCDGSQLLSASFDNTPSDGTRVVTDSSDCTVKVWDMKSTDCIHTFRTPPPLRGGDASVNSVHLFPKNTDHIVVCNMTSSVCIMTLHGQVVKSFSSGKRAGDFAAACVSPKGEWIYCVGIFTASASNPLQTRASNDGSREGCNRCYPSSS